ncbi:MAG: complex I NDUFA9 subunit family protein [Alphaproteobacteria bacterium]|nr:complex I NDUFA9 subunit family protein [Alphaproteobacteria bacterium]
MSNPLVTVFGGSGFLGRHAVRALAKAGWRVRVAVRHPNSAYFLTPMGHVGQIQPVRCNVRDAEQVEAALAGADAAVNLTGLLYQAGGGQSFTGIHVEAAGTIARAAAAARIRTLVHVSAIGADADSKCRYNETKGEGEAAVRNAFPDAAILRPSLMFGPEDAFFNKFATLARLVPALPLVGGGKTRFQPVFVGDVAAAVLRALQDTATRGKTYELGGPTIYTFKELMQAMLREIRRRRLLVPLPFMLASVKAFFLQMTKFVGVAPLLTPDQVEMLKTDNVASPQAPGLDALGIAPIALEAVIPSYLWRFRAKGQFEEVTPNRAPAQR